MAEVKLIDKAPIKRSQWVTITLRKDAKFVNITIYTAFGELIRKEALGPMKAGSRQWFWDGRNDMGELVGPQPFLITMTTDYETITSKSATGGEVFSCLSSLIREGWALVYAARKCGFELDEDVIANRNREQECIEAIIVRGGLESGLESYQSAYNQCMVTGPTVTEIPPEAYPTPTLPAPPIGVTPNGNGLPPINGNGPPGDDKPKKMPSWAWGAITFVGLILFSSMRRE